MELGQLNKKTGVEAPIVASLHGGPQWSLPPNIRILYSSLLLCTRDRLCDKEYTAEWRAVPSDSWLWKAASILSVLWLVGQLSRVSLVLEKASKELGPAATPWVSLDMGPFTQSGSEMTAAWPTWWLQTREHLWTRTLELSLSQISDLQKLGNHRWFLF